MSEEKNDLPTDSPVAETHEPIVEKQDAYDPSGRTVLIWLFHLAAIVGVNLVMAREYDFQDYEPTFSFNFIGTVGALLSLTFFTLLIDIAKGCNKQSDS